MPADPVAITLVCTALVVLLAVAIGALLGLRGDGRHLWIAAAAALVLAVIAVGRVLAGPAEEISDLLSTGLHAAKLVAYLAAFGATLLGLAACAAALVRSLRAHQLTVVVVLMVTAALPLLLTVAAFDYALLVPFRYLMPEQVTLATVVPGEVIAFALLPLGPAVLVEYATQVALRLRRRRQASS